MARRGSYSDAALLRGGIVRQLEPEHRALVGRVDRERGTERPRALLQNLDRPPPALGLRIVAARHLDPPAFAAGDRDRERLRRPPADRAVERLAHDLVERGLRLLPQRLGGG